MEELTTAIRNKMALKYGLIIGAIYLVLFTGINVLVGNFITYNAMRVIGYILYFVIMGMFITQIKKENGGYLEFKDAFGAAFVMILTANILYYVYSYVYFQWINPHFMEQMKVSVVSFMEKMKAPDDKIEKTIQDMDKQIADSKSFNLGHILMGFFGFLILDSLFGMIVCAIVKKNRPMFGNQ